MDPFFSLELYSALCAWQNCLIPVHLRLAGQVQSVSCGEVYEEERGFWVQDQVACTAPAPKQRDIRGKTAKVTVNFKWDGLFEPLLLFCQSLLANFPACFLNVS